MTLEEAITAAQQRHQIFLRWMAHPVRRKQMDDSDFPSREAFCLQEIESQTDFAAYAASELAFIYRCYGETLSCGAANGERLGKRYESLSITLGNPIGHLAIAWRLLDSSSSGTIARGIQELETGASKGCSACKAKLGQMYRDGDHVQQNYVEAEKLLLEAATIDAACDDSAESPAMLDIAMLYDDGPLGTPDTKRAEHWYNEFLNRVRNRYFHPSASAKEKQTGEEVLSNLRQSVPAGREGRLALRNILATYENQTAADNAATTGAEASPTPEPPPVFERIKRVLAEQLSIEKDFIDISDSLQYLGIDIRNLGQLVTALEKEFQMEIPKSAAKDFNSVRSVVVYILERRK